MASLIYMILCIIAASTAVGAFQPLIPSRQQTIPSCLFSSLSQPSTVDVRNDIEPIVTVEVVGSNEIEATAKTAALAGGPAYVASLENSVRSSESRDNSSPMSDVLPEEQMTQETPPPRPIPKIPSKEKKKLNAVRIAESASDLLDIMNGKNSDDNDDDVNNDALTLILFHAHYCKICQRAGIQLKKAAKEYPAVRFGKIESQVIPEPVSDNLRTLGVSKFPFVQIYRRGQCVASFSTGPTHMFMSKVRATLDLCLERDENCWDSFVTEFAEEIESNQLARRNLGPQP
mmetsp:Transcript_17310/g.37937  ORF Transcript_17310/g.37937 Transcript_17310/m.37937 type:complete len:288 (-) Transcript_17310:199-1062(-)|eukprot:CAMPEP_0168170940 /NCGR_PEP_ID=MMETSP0139_2-20121125/4445_1 /TAXON_ID=44445 /ORGANISM="Pseudo-nitzschia australis, Strain 10249 10 AB" /LENGTH=287 /DNA_ID=CAMNT_0008088471 /DNA_START=75 /DNA_END=938 /DNA_ORIENTATION=-